MMKYIIVEDEFLIRTSIQKIISDQFPGLELVAEFDVLDLLEDWLSENPVDLIFMDINLPDGSGMDFMKKNKPENAGIIFITAYPNFAVEAYRISAIDYILKPIHVPDFMQAVHKFFMYHDLQNAKKSSVEAPPRIQFDPHKRLIIPSSSGYLVYTFDEVLRLEGEGNYTRIHLASGISTLVSITLKIFHDALEPYGFARVHKSNLVNTSKVVLFKRTIEGGILTLTDASEVHVSRFYRQEFSSRFLQQHVCIGF